MITRLRRRVHQQKGTSDLKNFEREYMDTTQVTSVCVMSFVGIIVHARKEKQTDIKHI